MRSAIAEHRLELVGALLGSRTDLLRLEQDRVRFSLGVSAADLRIPFYVEPEVERLVTFAARQLMLLLVQRHRALIEPSTWERLMLSQDQGRLPPVGESLSPTSQHPEIRATASLALSSHPLLTGGLVSAWLGQGGGGRSLVAFVTAQLKRAVAEMAQSQNREETPALAALMLSSLFPAAEAALRSIQLGGAQDRAFRGAAGALLYLAVKLGAERAFREVKASTDSLLRAEAALGPFTLMGGRPLMHQHGATLYGCELGFPLPGFETWLGALGSYGPQAVEGEVFKQLASDRELGKRVEHAVAASHWRSLCAQLALCGEDGALSSKLTAAFRQYTVQPIALHLLIDDADERRRFANQALSEGGRTEAAGKLLTLLAEALKKRKEKEPLASFGLKATDAYAQYARATTALVCDVWVEKSLLATRGVLDARSGAESEGGLEGEYESGQLYLISLRDTPLLKAQAVAPMAHLFVDVKDFTRRTALLGQAAMADFLRREFYAPILGAAKQQYAGMTHLADKGGVVLNNLLGDALSMSGTVEGMVGLAGEIRRQLAAFEGRLRREVSSARVAEAVARIEEEFEKKASDGLDPVLLASAKEDALARARGEGLEAGVMVSFGPAPLVMNIEDEVFGRSRVAIAEKINESARGTARSGGARARADALLAAERARRGNPRLLHPWSVFVGAPLSFTVPQSVDRQVRDRLLEGDSESAMAALAEPIRQWLQGTADLEEGVGEIYNAGAAVSDEALRAYQAARTTDRVWRSVELLPEALAPEIRQRFFFHEDSLQLVIGFESYGRIAELFRFAGRAMFKGLERSGGIGIWELITAGALLDLIDLHHAARWMKQL